MGLNIAVQFTPPVLSHYIFNGMMEGGGGWGVGFMERRVYQSNFRVYKKVGGWGFQMSIIPAGKVWPQYQDNEKNEDDDII